MWLARRFSAASRLATVTFTFSCVTEECLSLQDPLIMEIMLPKMMLWQPRSIYIYIYYFWYTNTAQISFFTTSVCVLGWKWACQARNIQSVVVLWWGTDIDDLTSCLIQSHQVTHFLLCWKMSTSPIISGQWGGDLWRSLSPKRSISNDLTRRHIHL